MRSRHPRSNSNVLRNLSRIKEETLNLNPKIQFGRIIYRLTHLGTKWALDRTISNIFDRSKFVVRRRFLAMADVAKTKSTFCFFYLDIFIYHTIYRCYCKYLRKYDFRNSNWNFGYFRPPEGP